MKRVLTIFLALIIIGGSIFLYVTQFRDGSIYDDNTINEVKVFEISKDIENANKYVDKFLNKVDTLLELNGILREMVYSGKYDAKEIANLVIMQRMLMHDKLLMINSQNIQISKVISKAGEWKSLGLKIIGYEIEDTKYMREGETCSAIVKYYTNAKDTNIYIKYGLVKDENAKWHIIGFVQTDEFDVFSE